MMADNRQENDLLGTDVIEPGINGKDLAEHLVRLRPNLKYLFISGYTADIIAPRGVPGGGVPPLDLPPYF